MGQVLQAPSHEPVSECSLSTELCSRKCEQFKGGEDKFLAFRNLTIWLGSGTKTQNWLCALQSRGWGVSSDVIQPLGQKNRNTELWEICEDLHSLVLSIQGYGQLGKFIEFHLLVFMLSKCFWLIQKHCGHGIEMEVSLPSLSHSFSMQAVLDSPSVWLHGGLSVLPMAVADSALWWCKYLEGVEREKMWWAGSSGELSAVALCAGYCFEYLGSGVGVSCWLTKHSRLQEHFRE